MRDIHFKPPAEPYDVVIVGSGAGGGMAAYELTKAGARVCLLEAGQHYDPADPQYMTQMKWPWQSPRRGAATRFRPFGDFDAAYGGWDIEGEPYTTAPGTKFMWFRSRMLGGRTNHWGRISLRFGPDDFRRRSLDGLGEDWPVSYDEVKPFYDEVDSLLGVFGSNEGLPNDPDGVFLPPPKPRLHELLVQKANKNLGITTIPSRLSILTKKINDERGECFYCAQCNRACMAYADFSSSSCLVKPAAKSSNLEIRYFAMAREIRTDPKTGLCTGVSYIDTQTREEKTVRARIVILAASACESARLLLNSTSTRFPEGLANSSGVVGKYLHDSTGASRSAIIPMLFDRKRYNEDGVGGLHVYSPWWLDNKKLDFPRGYHIEYWGGMGMPAYGFGWGIEHVNGRFPDRNGNPRQAGGYGAALKDDYRRFYGAYIGMAGRGESVAREDNYCEIDPEKVDKYGIPILRFNYKHGEYERLQAKHMHETFERIIQEMGGVPLSDRPGPEQDYGLNAPGEIIHEVGTVRMGNNPKTSALNKYQQAHDVKNLFVVDGAPFPSQADKNCTWTILALSMRASRHIVQLRKQGKL